MRDDETHVRWEVDRVNSFGQVVYTACFNDFDEAAEYDRKYRYAKLGSSPRTIHERAQGGSQVAGLHRPRHA